METNSETHFMKPGKKPSTKPHDAADSTGARDAAPTLSIDIGGSGLKAAIVDADATLRSKRVRVATPHPCPPDLLVETLHGLVAPLLARDPVAQVSIGFPGFVRDNHVLTAPHLGGPEWCGVPLAARLGERLGISAVRMINDAEMQGLAAIEGRGLEFVLTLGTGAGTALFRDGELMPHLELAHHRVSKKHAYDEYIGDAARRKAGNARCSCISTSSGSAAATPRVSNSGCRPMSRPCRTIAASRAARCCGIRARCARRAEPWSRGEPSWHIEVGTRHFNLAETRHFNHADRDQAGLVHGRLRRVAPRQHAPAAGLNRTFLTGSTRTLLNSRNTQIVVNSRYVK